MARSQPRRSPVHPALKVHVADRQARLQDRVADTITRFAGSMGFAYVHVAWFAAWIATGVEQFPFGLLTLLVSLEAIFLSTFLLISQNRADERRLVLANAEWELVQREEQQNALEVRQNEELIELTRRILELTREIHALQHDLARARSQPAEGEALTRGGTS